MAYTDEQLAAAIRGYNFEKREGRTVLPPGTHPLGQRLRDALVRKDGTVLSALDPLAQAAAKEKEFNLVTVKSDRIGLADDTLRSRKTPQAPMTDEQLAAAIRGYNFEKREGRTVLPPATHPLGQRLRDALVRKDGRTVLSALDPLAQAAAKEKKFNLVTVKSGRIGLADDTLRSRKTPQQPVTNIRQYDPPGVPGGSGMFGVFASYWQPVPVAGAAAALNARPSMPSLGAALASPEAKQERSQAQGTTQTSKPVLPSFESLGLPEPDRRNSPSTGPSAPSPYRPGTPNRGRGGPAGTR